MGLKLDKRIIVVCLIVSWLSIVNAEADDDMDMDMGEKVEFHPVNPGSKTFHWILSLFLLLIIPSISATLALANKLSWSLLLTIISTGYSVFETLFLQFPDNVDNHENITSRNSSWILSILLGSCLFLGTVINGSNLVINRFYPHIKLNEYGISYKIFKVLSFIIVIVGWVRVCMAPVALFGFCYGRHTGQCIAHGIMGSAFILYSFVLSLVLLIPWIRKHQLYPNAERSSFKSQEFWDSIVMCTWGIVNTFTEHRWGREAWSMGDYQHTSMGIIWWAGGLLGIFLARKNNRTFIPSLLLIFTGYSMSQHAQHLEISTKVHSVFGLALMGAGAFRIVEISFLLKDKACATDGKILSFQYFPPFCLTLSGILFMSATEEQLILVHDLGADHSAYILVVSSAAFMIYLWIISLITLYLRLVGYDEDGELGFNSRSNEYVNVRDAEEFELGSLSDEENPTPDEVPPHQD
ncbi:hypothetical protein DFJ63DRAFT_54110 [Scheffersomyces coipomensis]|uniref:uncharacterized protein n=1 Tax=Scheffersomyces coipomensis TaxID=1788519 RepID=UPI00315DC261